MAEDTNSIISGKSKGKKHTEKDNHVGKGEKKIEALRKERERFFRKSPLERIILEQQNEEKKSALLPK